MIPILNKNYGFNVFNRPVEELLTYAVENKLKHIEINLTQNHSTLNSFDNKRITALNSFCKKNNISLSIHLPYTINISDIISIIRKNNIAYLKECIDFASKINATHITAHIGNFYWFPVANLTRKSALQRFVKYLADILKICEELKVIIAIENVVQIPEGSDFYLLGDNINDFKYIFENCKSSSLKFCLDTGHANMNEGAVKYIKELEEKLYCLHYHDNNGNNDEHLPIGEGTVEWTAIANELHKIRFSGPIISECRNIEPHNAALVFEDYFKKLPSD